MIAYRRALLASILALAMPLVAAGQESRGVIDAGQWTTSGKVGPFSEMRAAREGAAWLLRPSADDPNFTFGWLQGPGFTANPATDTLAGNNVGMRVRYSFNGGAEGAAPELRIRLNSEDFGQYAIAGVANNRFQQQKATGQGEVTVLLDRRQLSQPTLFFPYIDLLSADTGVSADWFVRIESVETFVTSSNSSYDRSLLVSTAYMDTGGSVFAHVGASPNRVPVYTRTSSTNPASLAYDGPHVIVIDNGKLMGFSATAAFARIDIATANIVYAALSDHHVAYLDRNGRGYYFNLLTLERRSLDPSSNYIAVSTGGDGALIYVKRRGNGTLELYQYDARLLSPSLTRLNGDNAAFILNTRSTGVVQ